MPRGLIAGLIAGTIALLLVLGLGHRSPAVIQPSPVNTNDPIWIVNHCDIPAVAEAHDLLC